MRNLMLVGSTTHYGRSARLVALALLSFGCGATPPGALLQSASAQGALSMAPSFGSAGAFAVLAGSAVTCTDSVITGDVGVWPGTAITQTNCTINGTVHPGDTEAAAAHIDFLSAYNALALQPCDQTSTVPLGDLTGVIVQPGVYCVEAASTTTGGTLTLDGPATGIWIFKIGTKGTGALTGTNFNVVMRDGSPPPCNNVYWWVAEAASMTDSNFVGTILAGAAITITRGTFNGDALAMAAVTMTNATVSACGGGGGLPSGCKDFVTGGGWICLDDQGALTSTGHATHPKCDSKGTFAVTGGMKHGELWGHLEYVDHGVKGPKGWKVDDMNVKGTGVTVYTVVDAKTRHIEGTAEVNGRRGYTYIVDVVDNGEPGSDDTFSLQVLKNGVVIYSASGKLAGGNIQLHHKCIPLICVPSAKDDDEGDGHDWHDVKDVER
jgi:hypothetical protein